MDECRVQPLGYGLAFDRLAPVSASRQGECLYGLPHWEQLQPDGGQHRLLWVPPDRVAEHGNYAR